MGRTNAVHDIFLWINTHNNDPSVCWEWLGSTGGRDGRGYFTLDGKKRLAYHVTYELFGEPNGPLTEDTVRRHTCDNPICCNPFHIVPGTRGQNEDDKYDRDRAGYTHDMIKEMRRLSKLGYQSYAAIAEQINKKFGTLISGSGVGKVLRGERRMKHGK